MQFGFSKRDISNCYEPGMAMMGWGMRYNQARGVAAPLCVRAVVLSDPATGHSVAWCTIDALIVTQGLWFGVVDALSSSDLGFDASNIIVTATHTHSGPSGYGHHFWTNLNAPGWSAKVYSGLRDAIVEAITQAHARLISGEVEWDQTTIPTSDGIAFNRSWFAYNQNSDVTPVTYERRDEATERLMSALMFKGPDGKVAGMWNWLATHGTCVHADNTLMHPDHKGLAALALEADGVDVVMAQECCGDVSPNYRWDKRRKHTMGRYDDDFRSAEHVGSVQARAAQSLIAAANTRNESAAHKGAQPATSHLKVASAYVDFSCARVDAKFSANGRRAETTPAQLGLSMAEGTAEGPGPLRNVRFLTRGGAKLQRQFQRIRRRDEDPKLPFINLSAGSDGRMLGVIPVKHMPKVDETMGWVGDAVRNGAVHSGPWIPQTVPIHLVTIGNVAILAVPFEMTTVAGRRLRATIVQSIPDVEHAVISTYANAYVGYLTTFEEYQVQHYEAGYTLFGPHTLGALQTAVQALAESALEASNLPGPDSDSSTGMGQPPWRPPTDILERLQFTRPWTD